MSMTMVAGICPACGYPTLVLESTGHITCAKRGCSRPTAAHEILGDGQLGHIIKTDYRSYQLQHPLHERLDGALFDCALSAYLEDLDHTPVPPGTYLVNPVDDESWSWVEMS